MLTITSPSNELIKKYCSLKNKKYRDEYMLYILEDIDLINKANEYDLIDTILFVNKPVNVNEDVKLIKTTQDIINKLSNVKTPHDVIAVCKITISKKGLGNKIIALDNVQDPGNGGTILRSALAFNFDSMLISDQSFDIYNDKFLRATKGSFFDMNIERLNLTNKLKELKSLGYKIVIADLTHDSISVNDFKFEEKVVLVVGNEGQGISKEVASLSDITVYIPISNKMESLNVAIAASIIMSKNNIDK